MDQLFISLTKATEGAALIALCASFAWGILSVILSPCHLSSIPLIIGFISEQGKLTTRRAFGLSFLFGLGILVTIAFIGILTASMGRIMGDVGKYGNYAVAAVFFIVGLHLIGLLKLPFVGAGNIGLTKKGSLAAFLLGLIFGIALGPCTFAYMAPVLTLAFKSASANPLYAVALLTVYGIGHCTVIVLAGASTEAVQNYLNWNEKTGIMRTVKGICGILVMMGGAYLIYTAG